MECKNIGKIKFQVETRRILEILSSEIYDSPYALLRENIQNAYDAILMRQALGQGFRHIEEGLIEVTINETEIIISDNGLGMTEEILRNNYWKAGSSGKKTELANKAGVIGTFGIGAMANFGICSKLRVETRAVDSTITLISSVDRDTISLSEECIDFESINDDREPGTKVIATIARENTLNFQQAIKYLDQYVRYIPVQTLINGIKVSQKKFRDEFIKNSEGLIKGELQTISDGYFNVDMVTSYEKSGNAVVEVSNIKIQDKFIPGEIVLVQGANHIMGLRSCFGLAPVPVGRYYHLGGIVNLSILQPTAGREALSRESIDLVNKLISLVEKAISEELSTLEFADKNTAFINYIYHNARLDLANRVLVQIEPNTHRIELGKIEENSKTRKMYYYSGNDKSIIETFASGETMLILISQSNPRRQVQQQYINRLGIEAVPDQAQVISLCQKSQLAMDEVFFSIRVANILEEDYLLRNVEIHFAAISHGVPYLVQEQGGIIKVYFERNSSTILPVLNCFKTAPEVFVGFVKDFVRVHLYSRILNFVPSSTREGADALQKILRKNKELYKYEPVDFGRLEYILSDFISGQTPFNEVLKSAANVLRSQAVTVNKEQIGQVEQEIPDIVNSPVIVNPNSIEQSQNAEYPAAPAITRLHAETQMKILTVEQNYNQLNNFNMFLALSDRVFKTEMEFFLAPHVTKVIWGSHKVIYIFTHVSSMLTFYYEIELKEPIKETTAGGGSFPTTTIVTKNKIFVPIPPLLVPSFKIEEGVKEFYVRYDIITE